MPIENIKLYLDKAKEMSKLPDEETDVLSLEMELETIGFIRGIAAAWGCTPNEVIVASLLAICNEKPQRLEEMVKSTDSLLN